MTKYKNKKERNINRYKNLIDSNSDKIDDLKTTNDSLMFSMVRELKTLLDEHFGLNSRLINSIRKEKSWNDDLILYVQDRLVAYYDLKVNVTALGTLGYGDDCYYIYFTYDKVEYQLTIPNLIDVDNFEKCYGGMYRLHYKESEHVWDFVNGISGTYYLDELLEDFKKHVGYIKKGK